MYKRIDRDGKLDLVIYNMFSTYYLTLEEMALQPVSPSASRYNRIETRVLIEKLLHYKKMYLKYIQKGVVSNKIYRCHTH